MNNIEIYGYILDEHLFANTSVNPYNNGFCTPAANCLPAGVFNLTNCIQIGIFNAPIYMSLPHFLFGDPKLVADVDGLNPIFDKHKTIVFFEPLTGIPITGHKRVQLSTKLYRDPKVPFTMNLPEIYFPLFWLDEVNQIKNNFGIFFLFKMKSFNN